MTREIDVFDYQQHAILFVDDEANTRKYFKRLFGERFRILEAANGVEALAVFRQHAGEIGIIMTDQRMPEETGVGFLSKIADHHPDIIKILSTAYSDIDAAIGSVNQGGIFRYMTKPWDIPQLEVTLRRAMEFFTVRRERDALHGAKVREIGKALLAARLAAFALVPVCAGICCRRAAEAIADFVRTGLAGRRPDFGADSTDWAELNDRQVLLASALEKKLPEVLAPGDLAGRTTALAASLESAGASAILSEPSGPTMRLSASADPLPGLVEALLGANEDPGVTENSTDVLAAFLAIYDAGGEIRRVPGDGLALEVTPSSVPPTVGNPGAEAAKWLFDEAVISGLDPK